MKNVFKVLGVIALVAVIGFGFVGCGGGDDGGGDNNNNTTVAVTGVTLAPKTLSLTVGGATGTLYPTVAPDNATNKTVTWTSSNPAVATVANGVVTPLTAGNTTITATAGSFSDTCAVTVNPPATPTTNVSISLEALYGGGTDNTHMVLIYLSLPSGAKWTLPEEGEDRDITDAQALAAVKSWVTITSGTTPAITGWDFSAWYEDDSKIGLSYYRRSGTGVSRSSVTAKIDTTKLSEMKSKTNVTDTLTASPGTATESWSNF